ncbi:MAG: hypothetical protein Q4E03_06035 [Trueperella sp.]|nr:hypothetical protein [Trueperella sp.]
MEKFYPMLFALVGGFTLFMLGVGWYTAWRAGFAPAIVVACVLGTMGAAFAAYGIYHRRTYLVAGSALAVGLIFPTIFGIAPMIAGFVLFVLLVSLEFFITTSGGTK